MMFRKGFGLIALLLISAGLLFANGTAQPQAGTAAATGGTPTLTVGIQSNIMVIEFDDNYQTRYMEKMNNVNLEFYVLPVAAADTRSKISLMVSSNDLPDVLQVILPIESWLEYGTGGALIDQTPYIMDRAKSPNFWKIPESERNILLSHMRAADGKIYNQLGWQPESWDSTPHRQYINKAWLDKLGLKIPTTTEELRTVLAAFRSRDPNGNGRQDEIGVFGYFRGGYGENVTAALINSFVFYNKDQLTLDETGNTIIAPFVQPGFRQALQYLASLNREGLLDSTLFTNNQQEYRATLATNPSVVGFVTAGSASNWADADRNANFLQLAMIPPLKGPAGISYTPFVGYVPHQVGAISSKSKIPDIAWKYLDSFYDHDVSIISRFGEEGVDWTRDPEVLDSQTNAYVSAGLYPRINVVETSLMWATPNRTIWGNPGPRYASEEQGNTRGSTVRPFTPDSAVAILDAYNYQWYVPSHPQHILAPLKYNLSEAQTVSLPITNIREFVQQAIAEFTTGTRDINSDAAWNAYLRELDAMGLKEWISVSQAAYNRTK